MSERKLVTIRAVDSVEKHPGADVLDLVKIGGWQCASKLGTFKTGDWCFYVEIDAFVPIDHPAFAFLGKNAIKWNGKTGARIKTIKLRGEISQGLLIPLHELPELRDHWADEPEEFDYAETLGIEKWERVLPASLGGTARGNFPSFLRKTDQERVQNYWNGFGHRGQFDVVEYKHPETGELVTYGKPRKYIRDTLYEVTVKLDGSSMTAYYRDGDFGVCSRNLDLVETEGNSFWQVANKLRLRERMTVLGRNIAIQGELCGPSIQGNNDKLAVANLYVFDVFDIDRFKPLNAHDRAEVITALNLAIPDFEEPILTVPLVEVRHFDFERIEDALDYASGPSLNLSVKREGVVFKSIEDPDFSFKIISNEYLLANSDR